MVKLFRGMHTKTEEGGGGGVGLGRRCIRNEALQRSAVNLPPTFNLCGFCDSVQWSCRWGGVIAYMQLYRKMLWEEDGGVWVMV